MGRGTLRTTCKGLLALLLLASDARAQAGDPPCIVSILNQTAIVQPDGTWVVSNVPANMGEVRAQIVCTRDGQTLTGTSDRFVVVANAVNTVENLVAGLRSETAVSIDATVPSATISQPGPVQLTVSATYSDGSIEDVTSSEDGTTYATTSPAVASVNAEGLVNVVGSGRVLVTAMHEAIIDTVILTVSIGGDRDADGIPDDWEVANGLNPNDPVDALEDLDSDVLVNREEFLRGTLPRDPDTDDDALLDGREVRGDPWAACPVRYNSEPALRDTDGDGLSDGLESTVCTNPRDPLSPAGYQGLLTAIDVAPPSFTMTVNAALPLQVTRQLKVTGVLVDGSTIDLTVNRGTVYTSSNVNAAIVTSAGRVFPGPTLPGTADITATNGGLSDTTHASVATFTPTSLSFTPILAAQAIVLTGDYGLVPTSSALVVVGGLPLDPVVVAELPGAGGEAIALAGDRAYVAGTSLHVIDVAAPTSPTLLSSIVLPRAARDVAVEGAFAYLSSQQGLMVADLEAAGGVVVTTTGLATGGAGLASEGGLLAATASSSLRLFELADPRVPQLVGTESAGSTPHLNVTLRDGFAYVPTAWSMAAMDVRDHQLPFVTGRTVETILPADVALDGPVAFLADHYAANAIPFYDVSGPAPVILGSIDFYALTGNLADGLDVETADGFIYLIAGGAVSTGTGLYVGRYAVYDEDPGDPPTVTLINPAPEPAPHAQVIERRSFTATAEAGDDLLTLFVDFELDGVRVARDYKPPFEAVMVAPTGVPSFTVTARATDRAGLTGASSATVDVIPDARPVVTIVTPRADVAVAPGTIIQVAAQASDDSGVITVVTFEADGAPIGGSNFPPYRTQYLVPTGVASFTITATAQDGLGFTGSASVIVPVQDAPPQVAILEPPDGFQVVTGATVHVDVAANDDVAIGSLELYIDGSLAAQSSAPQLLHDFNVTSTTDITLRAVASDLLGQSAEHVITLPVVVDDPLTRVVGRVVGVDGGPAVGADVTLQLQHSSSGSYVTQVLADGTFEIQGVPTLQGRISASIRRQRASGDVETGGFAPAFPVQGGTTDLGSTALRASTQGPFYPCPRMDAGEEPRYVAAGDLDADGLADFVTTRYNEVSVVLNNGNGTHSPRLASYTAGLDGFYSKPVIGDFDGDGKADVAVDRKLYLGQGDGRLRQTTDSPDMVVGIADMDGDLIEDLVVVTLVGSQTPFDLGIRWGAGGGSYSDLQVVVGGLPAQFVWDVAVGHLDGDGLPDIAMGTGTQTFVVRHTGPRTLGQTLLVDESSFRVRIADLDGDGAADLVTNDYTESFRVWINDGAGGFPGFVDYPAADSAALDFAVAHVDGDSVPDILYGSAWAGSSSVTGASYLPGTGSGTFGSPVALAGPNDVVYMASSDVDGDGYLDVAATSVVGDYSVVVMTFARNRVPDHGDDYVLPAQLSASSRSIALADVTSDGIPDLVAATQNLEITVLRGLPGGTFGSAVTSPAAAGLWALDTEDLLASGSLTPDGKPDVVAIDATSNVTIYAAAGDGHFSVAMTLPVPQVATGVAIADVDGVFGPDIVTLNLRSANLTNRRSITVFLRRVDGTFAPGVDYAANADQVDGTLEIGEVTGSGGRDVVFWGRSLALGVAAVIVFPGNGDGTFAASVHTAAATGFLSREVALVDIDGAGGLDVVMGASYQLSTGGGALSTAVLLPTEYDGVIAVADVTRDGRADVLSGYGRFPGAVELWQPRGSHLEIGPRYSMLPNLSTMAVADLDADGTPDVVTANRGTTNPPTNSRVRVLRHAAEPWECDPASPATTTATGLVELGGVLVAGATVTIDGVVTTTDGDGHFQLASVDSGCPRRRIRAFASSNQGGLARAGGSGLLLTIPGGVTDLGTIQLETVYSYLAGGLQSVGTGSARRLVWIADERGATTPLSGSTTTSGSLTGLAWSGGNLYALNGTAFVRINTTTGLIAQTIGTTRNPVNSAIVTLFDLASDPSTGLVYGLFLDTTRNPVQTVLCSISTTNAALTVIGNGLGDSGSGGIAVSGGFVYRLNAATLSKVNPSTGGVVESTPLPIDNRPVGALGPRPDGKLVASLDWTNHFFIIDPVSKSVTGVPETPTRPGDLAELP